jgi:uncharacterized protein (DUF1800 family)
MATDPITAMRRFGLGPRPGDLARLGGDPRGALLAELETPDATSVSSRRTLPDSAAAFGELQRFVEERAAARERARAPGAEGARSGRGMTDEPKPERSASPRQTVILDEIEARIETVLRADIGFAERLAAFWTNHFAIGLKASRITAFMAGAFEREAVRPHVLGRFEDMLVAVTQHPAMLAYLDNVRSVGPNSPVGVRRGSGLNENHAREILELHTVGVDGGYRQADIAALARVLTGWTVARTGDDAGRFRFDPRRHEPGAQTVLGVRHAENGVEQGEAVLRDLAARPETARHVAFKLARSFCADDPPQELVERLAAAFLGSGGDLKHVASTMVRAEAAWDPAFRKFRSPQEFLWSSLRALHLSIPPRLVLQILRTLGHPLWDAPSPQGFSDVTSTWLAPDALTDRLDVAERLAMTATVDDPTALVDAVLGPDASAETRDAVRHAETRRQGLALLLMSREFQWR